MPSIPLGLQAYERSDGYQPETKLVNLFIEKDESGLSPDENMRLQRPGLTSFTTISGSMVRGLHYSDGIADSLPVAVVGTGVYTMDGATNTSIGTVTNDGDTVSIASTYDKLGIVSGGLFYVYNGTTLAAVTMPDSAVAIAVETMNGYFIIATADGTFYWLAPDETTIDALNFATAESSPDGLVTVERLGDELFFFGTSTVEVWQSTGDVDAPFQRAAGRLYDKGCAGRDTVQAFDNAIVWLGSDNIVYRASNVPQRISTSGIEERLRKRSGDASAFTFVHDAHLFYVLRIPGQGSFALDALTGKWSEFTTYGATLWKPHVSVKSATQTFVGDSTSGKVWLVDANSNTDDGTIIERIVTGAVAFNGKPVRIDSFQLYSGSSADTVFQVRWYDGRETPGTYTNLSVRAPLDNAAIRRLGMAYQPTRTFEVRCITNTKVRISGAMFNDGGAWNNR